jgi:hypothetical protein
MLNRFIFTAQEFDDIYFEYFRTSPRTLTDIS